MPQTIAEKLFSRHNLAGEPVHAGDILEARIDGAMVHYHVQGLGVRSCLLPNIVPKHLGGQVLLFASPLAMMRLILETDIPSSFAIAV
jgi:hypothetical protein